MGRVQFDLQPGRDALQDLSRVLAAAQGGQELRAVQSRLAESDGAGQREQREPDHLQPVRESGQESGALHQADPGDPDGRSAKDLADGDPADGAAAEHAQQPSAQLPSDAATAAATVEHDEPAAPDAATAPIPLSAAFEPNAHSIADVQPPVADREPPVADQPVNGPVADDEPADDDESAKRTDEPNGQPDEQSDEQPDAGPATADDAVNASSDEQPNE